MLCPETPPLPPVNGPKNFLCKKEIPDWGRAVAAESGPPRTSCAQPSHQEWVNPESSIYCCFLDQAGHWGGEQVGDTCSGPDIEPVSV